MADLKLKFVSCTISHLKNNLSMSDVNSVLQCRILSYREKLECKVAFLWHSGRNSVGKVNYLLFMFRFLFTIQYKSDIEEF